MPTSRHQIGHRRAARGPSPVMCAFSLMLMTAIGATASAQGMPDGRVALSVSEGYKVNATAVDQTTTFEQYSETGRVTTTYAVRRRPSPEAGMTLRLWRHLGVGLSGTYLHDPGPALVHALVPHPLVFGQPRPVSGPADAAYTEGAVHIQVAYWLQPVKPLQIVVSGGPSVFSVDQDLVSDVTYTQTYPYDTAAYAGASVVREHRRVIGTNMGADVAWLVTRHLGFVAAVRFSRATTTFAGATTSAMTIGGLHTGGGLRVLF